MINSLQHKCWIISSGLTGSENQCLGIAERLNMDIEIIKIKPSIILHLLSPWGTPVSSKMLLPPWPKLAIAAGRRTIPYLKYIKKKSQGKCKTVYLQDPKINSESFDIVWAPSHDKITGPNVFKTVTSPNRVSKKILEDSASVWKEEFSGLPRPLIAILVGGKSRAFVYNKKECRNVVDAIEKVIDEGGTPLISTSRRTPEKLSTQIKETIKDKPHYYYDNLGRNPYFAFLRFSDVIVCTPDSANMISEALSVPKPTYVIKMKTRSKRFQNFIESLKSSGHIREFEGRIDKFQCSQLNPTKEIADLINKEFSF